MNSQFTPRRLRHQMLVVKDEAEVVVELLEAETDAKR